MWSAIWEWVKGLFGGKGGIQIGKDNKSFSTTAGDGATVISAGGDVIIQGAGTSAARTEKEELIDWLRKNGLKEPVSHVLQHLLRLAQLVGNKHVEHWAQMELFGYDREGGMTKDDVVPEYRAVVGQYYDVFERPLHFPPEMHFVNSYRFRLGVGMLEELAKGPVSHDMRDPVLIEMLEKEINVKISRFSFATVGLSGVLSMIRNHAIKKFNELEK